LNAAFVFLTREEAIHFKTAEKWGAHILYRVELCDPSALSHVTDWRLLTPHGTLRPDWADAYWVGINSVATSIPGIDWAVATNGIPLREMLTLSQLRVKERLD
jgi:hypothetical protein